MKVRDIDKAEDWFNRHGPRRCSIDRLVPVVRRLIRLPAGVERMPVALFLR